MHQWRVFSISSLQNTKTLKFNLIFETHQQSKLLQIHNNALKSLCYLKVACISDGYFGLSD